MPGRPINLDRKNALDLGLSTYIGAAHYRCGTRVRYVVPGNCVHCARVAAAEQRQTKKFLKQHAINEAEEMIARHDGVELDSLVPDGLDTDEMRAEADRLRFQAGIDELM